MEHEIIVGNIGTVYSGSNYIVASAKFTNYVKASKSNVGRAGRESVTWFKDNEIFKEYSGTLNHE